MKIVNIIAEDKPACQACAQEPGIEPKEACPLIKRLAPETAEGYKCNCCLTCREKCLERT